MTDHHCTCPQCRHHFDPHALVVTGSPHAERAPVLQETWDIILVVLRAADGDWLALTEIRDGMRRPPSTVANLIRAAKNYGVLEHTYMPCPLGHRHLMVRLPQGGAA